MATNIYTIYVKTGDDTLAGTDSNVFIQLFGTTGQTESIHLPAKDVFSFEAGSVDKFIMEVPDVGDLTRCCVGQDDTEGDSAWYVVEVRVEDDETDRVWTFTFDQWIGDDGKLFACVEA